MPVWLPYKHVHQPDHKIYMYTRRDRIITIYDCWYRVPWCTLLVMDIYSHTIQNSSSSAGVFSHGIASLLSRGLCICITMWSADLRLSMFKNVRLNYFNFYSKTMWILNEEVLLKLNCPDPLWVACMTCMLILLHSCTMHLISLYNFSFCYQL